MKNVIDMRLRERRIDADIESAFRLKTAGIDLHRFCKKHKESLQQEGFDIGYLVRFADLLRLESSAIMDDLKQEDF